MSPEGDLLILPVTPPLEGGCAKVLALPRVVIPYAFAVDPRKQADLKHKPADNSGPKSVALRGERV